MLGLLALDMRRRPDEALFVRACSERVADQPRSPEALRVGFTHGASELRV